MLKKEVGEDLRLNALDRLRAVTHQQLSLLGDGRATGGAGGQAVHAVRRLLAAGG
jgi:hypothetical protein